MLVNLRRILKFGWQSFWRNRILSFQVIFIFSIAIFIATLFFFISATGNILTTEAQKKFDISVYFKTDAEEADILKVRDELLMFSPEVKAVEYTSKDEALEDFLAKHHDDILYTQALDEIEENPFLASLNIKSDESGNYAAISTFLEQGNFKGLIERISYSKNKQVIDKLFSITNKIKMIGLGLTVLFGALAFFITFNTVRMMIYSTRDEISTMRLVGASNWFIRGPLIIQGFLYGIFSFLLVDLAIFGVIMAFKNQIADWFFNFDLLEYFVANLWVFVLVQFALATILGVVSTLLAVHKYLKR